MITPPWPVPLGRKPIDLQLERVRAFLARLGNPEKRLPPVVHIAGTNGKGSTLAFLRAMLEAAGHHVHMYTSPHLIEFNERILLAGTPIADTYLLDILDRCKRVSEGIPVTFFEGTTVAALLAFAETPADIVLFETGLGGRLDATNILEQPRLTAITPISYDHMTYLGNTLTEIAAEKAAIIKHNIPCVVSQQEPEVLDIIAAAAAEKSAPLFCHNQEWHIAAKNNALHYRSPKNEYTLPLPNLPGAHQIINAGGAIACAEQLDEFAITQDHIAQGLIHAYWPGRLQQLSPNSFTTHHEIWLDGGHNAAAGQALADTIKTWHPTPTYLITGMLEHKDYQAFLDPVIPHATALYTVPIPGDDPCIPSEILADYAASHGITAYAAPDITQAIATITQVTSTPARILICGSLYLVGSALAMVKQPLYSVSHA